MSDQEMQFADPEWKSPLEQVNTNRYDYPSETNSAQLLDTPLGNSDPREQRRHQPIYEIPSYKLRPRRSNRLVILLVSVFLIVLIAVGSFFALFSVHSSIATAPHPAVVKQIPAAPAVKPTPAVQTPVVQHFPAVVPSKGSSNMLGGNAQHTHFNGDEKGISTTNAPGLTVAWQYGTNDVISSSPAVVNGVVYFGSLDSSLYAVNEQSGKLVWRYYEPGSSNGRGPGIVSSPAVVNGVVYFGAYDSELIALDASTGRLLWKYDVGNKMITDSPAVVDGIVYIASFDGKIVAVQAQTGQLLWSYTTATDDFITSSPAVDNGIVYVGSSQHSKLYALDAHTGALLWTFTAHQGILDTPTVVNGVVYFGSYDFNVYALDAKTGALKWSYTLGQSVLDSSPAVADGIVYIGAGDSKLYALDAQTGSLLWTFTTGDTIDSSPMVANGVVYVGSNDEKLYALDAHTGTLLWSFTTQGVIENSPVVVNSMVFVGSFDHQLYAFHVLQ